MTSRLPACLAYGIVLLLNPLNLLHAWGPEGHAAIGIMAMQLADDTARQQLDIIFGSTDDARMESLCNWPDRLRDQAEWDWASPQHYVNIPRSATDYDAERDCGEGLCVTEAIKKYANQLGNEHLPGQQRELAFAWLCHLVGDLHQPLHCGFPDDRGGNTILVEFNGAEMKLHEYWDRQLILQQSGSLSGLLAQTGPGLANRVPETWNPAEVDQWTSESHRLAASFSYPPALEIDEDFNGQSWELILRRLPLAAERLAQILNATLGEGEVNLEN